MLFPILAGLGALSMMSNPRRKRRNPKGLIGVAPDGTRYSTKKNYDTGEWMIVAYVNGKRHEGRTLYFDDKQDAIDTFHFLMKTKANPKQRIVGARISVSRAKAKVIAANYQLKRLPKVGFETALFQVDGYWVYLSNHGGTFVINDTSSISKPLSDKAAAILGIATNPPKRGRKAKRRAKALWRTVTTVTNSRVTKKMRLNPVDRSGVWFPTKGVGYRLIITQRGKTFKSPKLWNTKAGAEQVARETRHDGAKPIRIRVVRERTNPDSRTAVTQRLPVIRHTIRLPREYDPRTATTQRLKAIKTNPRRRRSC